VCILKRQVGRLLQIFTRSEFLNGMECRVVSLRQLNTLYVSVVTAV